MNCLLPTPEQRPAADVVIYDGQCRFCTAQAQRLARLDRGERLAYLSLHDPSLPQRLSGSYAGPVAAPAIRGRSAWQASRGCGGPLSDDPTACTLGPGAAAAHSRQLARLAVAVSASGAAPVSAGGARCVRGRRLPDALPLAIAGGHLHGAVAFSSARSFLMTGSIMLRGLSPTR